MRKRDRDKFKATLLEMRRETMRDIQDEVKEGREGDAGEGRDTYDIASDERDREISLLLDDRERKKITLFDDALSRVESGDYGECFECEGDIAIARLRAMPFTRLCITCQDEYERAQRTMQSDTMGMSSTRVGGSDTDGDPV